MNILLNTVNKEIPVVYCWENNPYYQIPDVGDIKRWNLLTWVKHHFFTVQHLSVIMALH